MNIIVKFFLGLGGLGVLSHLVIAHGGEGLKTALIWIMGKYPALRRFSAEHGPAIIALCQSLDKGIEGAIEDAEKREGIPGPRPTDL